MKILTLENLKKSVKRFRLYCWAAEFLQPSLTMTAGSGEVNFTPEEFSQAYRASNANEKCG